MRNVRRYTVLGTAGARLISTDRIEVAVLAMYKYGRSTMKWADMVKSAKSMKNATLQPSGLKYEGYRIIDNHKSVEPEESKEAVFVKRKAIDWEMAQVKRQVEALENKLLELKIKREKLDYV